VVEIIGETGLYDYVEFLAEGGAYTPHDLEGFARAAELKGLSTMIKVGQGARAFLAEQALAAGIQNVLFAGVRRPEDVVEAVKAVRAEPKGGNGIKVSRQIGYTGHTRTARDFVAMCDDAVVAIMVEKREAVDRLEELLGVGGVDMVQFGPADYALSLGLPGEISHPKVREAELRTIKTALRMDIRPRAEIREPREAQRYLELGVRDFSLNMDVRILYGWLREKGEELRRELGRG
jgi:2-keto-3-deoxy-L-rhamnonate aldolase RhmA